MGAVDATSGILTRTLQPLSQVCVAGSKYPTPPIRGALPKWKFEVQIVPKEHWQAVSAAHPVTSLEAEDLSEARCPLIEKGLREVLVKVGVE
jgi:hypothetical protein